MKVSVSASLVLFHNEASAYGAAISSFLASSSEGQLYLIDNSASPLNHPLFEHPRVRYTFAGKNLGFGAGHNRALAQMGTMSEFHLLLNPDVRFDANVLSTLLHYAASDASIGAVMPRINFPDGTQQNLCKLLPTPVDLILRRFVPLHSVQARLNSRYEILGLPQDRPVDVPSLSGCFLLVRTQLLQDLRGFDERYFMYMEDVDLVRRIGDVSRTVYYPHVSVEHAYAKASYRNRKLLGYHLRSATRYFDKWGWWSDPNRRRRNAEVARLIARL